MSDEDVPKPEMLEKADAIHRSLVPHGIRLYGDPCPVCRIIALALEEAAQTEADRTTAAIHSLHLQIEAQREALRASEASVKSLRKERLTNEWLAFKDSFTEKHRTTPEGFYYDGLVRGRAEATKAETLLREWHLKLCTCGGARSWPHGTYAASCLACGKMNAAIRAPRPPEPEMCNCSGVSGPNLHPRGFGACVEPSPTPPTSPLGTCLIQGRTAHIDDGKCIDWKPEPTPPSEEPR